MCTQWNAQIPGAKVLGLGATDPGVQIMSEKVLGTKVPGVKVPAGAHNSHFGEGVLFLMHRS